MKSNLKVILINMGDTRIIKELQKSLNIVGVIESKRKNSDKNTIYMENYCRDNALPYYFMNEGCDEKLENWSKKLNPELIVIVSMSVLLKKNIIDIPKKGCINLHPSFLPKYRGGYPFFWTFFNFDLFPGVTVHYIDEGEDTGDIIYQECFKLPIGSTEEELMDLLIYKNGIRLLIKAIHDIEKQCAPRIKQPKESPTARARQIKPEEYQSIVKWEEWEIERIWHLLRGTQNWLNVFDFSEIKEKVLKWRILNFKKDEVNLEFGKVFKEKDHYFVACKQGKIFMSLLLE